MCDYASQFRAGGSAIYQLAHVPTGYPAAHDGIIIDECNPSAWLPEQELTPAKLQAATAAVPTGSVADLLRAVQATLTDAAQAKSPLTGRALFDALARRCNGQLAAWLGALTQHPEVTDPHPWPGGLDIFDTNAAQVAAALPPVVLPQLWRALAQELSRWLAQGTGTAVCASARDATARRWRSTSRSHAALGRPQRGCCHPGH